MIDRVFFVSGGFVFFFLVYAINTPTQFMKEGKKDRKQKTSGCKSHSTNNKIIN